MDYFHLRPGIPSDVTFSERILYGVKRSQPDHFHHLSIFYMASLIPVTISRGLSYDL